MLRAEFSGDQRGSGRAGAGEFSEWPCSLARAVDVFGDSWTLLIVRDALQGLTRFDEFQRSLNIARKTLSDRLGKLVDAGVMAVKRFYQDNPPR